jgi:hypothetical protein
MIILVGLGLFLGMSISLAFILGLAEQFNDTWNAK